MAQLGSGRRWKRVAALGVVIVAAAGVGGYVLLKNLEQNQAAALTGQWAALQACVLGDGLNAGEAPEARVRDIQLTVLGTPREQRAKLGELGWPANCATSAAALSEHAESAETGGAELKASAAALSKAMREDVNATADIGKLVAQVWKDAAAAKLSAPAAANPGVPKPAVALFPREVLREPSGLAGEFAISSLKPDPAPAGPLRFLIDDSGLVGGSALCTAGGVPTTLSCKHLPADVARHTPGLSLEGTTDAAAEPWIFAGDKGQLGIFRPAGAAAVTGELASGSSVDKDGSAWLLLHPGDSKVSGELTLTHAPLTGEVPRGRSVLDPSDIDAATDATLAWDWVVERTGAKAHPPAHLVGHKVSDRGELGPAVDIGDAAAVDRLDRDDKQPRWSTCKSGGTFALRAHGAKSDLVTFYTGSQWTAPLPLKSRGGVMACVGNEAVVTQVTGISGSDTTRATVEQERCNPSGCTRGQLPIREMLSGTDVIPQEPSSFTAAEVNGKLLLVWSAGPLGGLRMRYAPLDRMKATPDELITDSRDDSGQSPVTEVRLLATVDGAILFVNTTNGVRLFNVDGSGKLSVLHAHI